MNLRKYILLFNLLFYVSAAQANITINEDRYARFSSLTTNDGLCGDYVLDILQDDKGFIWIATTEGLSRYDGYRFVNYKNIPGDSSSVSDNYIQTLAIDEQHTLWVGTKNSLNIFDYESSTFSKYSPPDSSKTNISNPYIRKILPDENGILWVETVDGILNKLDTKSGDVKYYPHEPVSQEYYSYHCLFKDSQDKLWVGNRGKGPYLFDPETEKFKLIEADPSRKDKKRDQEIAYVLEDSKGRYWMGAIDGFWRYYPKTETFERIIGSSSLDIIEDKEGWLWLSGGKGLYRYNADTGMANHYINIEDDENSLIDNSVTALHEDRDGNIWIGTKKGVALYSKQSNLFKHIRHFSEDHNSLISNNITSILEDSKKNVWFGTKNKGLNKWNRGNDDFTLFQHSNSDKNTIASNRISCLYEDENQDLWIGLWQGVGFNKIEAENNTLKKYAYRPNSFKADWYNAFLSDKKGRFITGIWGANGMHFFDRENGEFEKYNFSSMDAPTEVPINALLVDDNFLWTARTNGVIYNLNIQTKKYNAFAHKQTDMAAYFTPESKSLKSNFNIFSSLNTIHKTRNNTLLFATSQGLIKVDEDRKTFHQLISDKNVLALAEGKLAGRFWLGLETGLGYLDANNKLRLIANSNSKESFLHNKTITDLLLKDDILYIGTDECMLLYNTQTQKIDSLKATCLKERINVIRSNTNDNIYIGTNNGLYKIDKSSATIDTLLNGLVVNDILLPIGRSVYYVGTNKGIISISNDEVNESTSSALEDYIIYALGADKDGNIWAGTPKGIIKYIPMDGSVDYFNKANNKKLSSHLITFLANDSHGNIWAGTSNKGVNKINSNTLDVIHFMPDHEKENAFWGEKATCFYQQKNGTIWIGGEGLNKYNPETNSFSHFTTKNGLPHNTIYSILEDKSGNLWIGTEKGLVVFDPLENKLCLLDKYINLPFFDFSGGATQLESGNFLFAGNQGAFLFNPELIHCGSTNNSAVQLTGFKLFADYHSDFIPNTGSIHLNYKENFFTFEFSAFDFGKWNQNFLYKLDGIDKDYVKTDGANSASYTKIPSGKYRFQVKKDQPDAPITNCFLIIHPPFWRTWWFIVLVSLAVVGIIYFVVHTIVKRQKIEEQKIVLEHKLLRLQMNPHFIFNVLIAIQSFIYKKDTYESGLYLSKFAKLMRIFLQNSRKDWITMSSEIEALNYYISLQQLRNEGELEIEIDCENIPGTDYIFIPPMIIQPFIENAIEHGFSGGVKNGKISVRFALKSDYLEAIIIDDGVGLKNATKLKYKDKNHDSLATEIISERLNIMNGSADTYGLYIEDLSVLGNTSSGTKVTIKLPYKEEF